MSEFNDVLLSKWLTGELTESELKMLEKEYDLQHLKQTLDQQKEYIPETVNSIELWDKIKANRQNEKITPSNTNQGRNKRHWILGIILTIIALLFAFLFYNHSNTNSSIQTHAEKLTHQSFADGSKVKIGPNSLLQYNAATWNEKRNVQLSGQAFFEVEKGKTFTVSTVAGTIEVLGTKFDVWAIHKKYMSVFCKEGKVSVTDNSGTTKTISGHQYVYIAEGKIGEIKDTDDDVKDWQMNFRNYDKTPFVIVLSDLKRFYSKTFTVDKNLEKDLFTGILPTNDLAKCLQFIEASLSYEIEQDANTIHFNQNE